jgi:hypothetical protein
MVPTEPTDDDGKDKRRTGREGWGFIEFCWMKCFEILNVKTFSLVDLSHVRKNVYIRGDCNLYVPSC